MRENSNMVTTYTSSYERLCAPLTASAHGSAPRRKVGGIGLVPTMPLLESNSAQDTASAHACA